MAKLKSTISLVSLILHVQFTFSFCFFSTLLRSTISVQSSERRRLPTISIFYTAGQNHRQCKLFFYREKYLIRSDTCVCRASRRGYHQHILQQVGVGVGLK